MTQRDVESFADFLQYYAHSYVRSRSDPKVMYYVHGNADPLRLRAYVNVFKDGERHGEGMYIPEAKINEDFVWGLPLIGMTVLDERQLVFLYYRTARNGGRGFASSRVLSYSFNGHVLRQHGLKPAPIRFDQAKHAWAAITQKHATLEYAYKDLTSKRPTQLAHALTYKFGIHLTEEEHPILCYKTNEVGEVLGPNHVRLQSKHRELKELMQRVISRNIEVEVV
jgi:hypothetical protein